MMDHCRMVAEMGLGPSCRSSLHAIPIRRHREDQDNTFRMERRSRHMADNMAIVGGRRGGSAGLFSMRASTASRNHIFAPGLRGTTSRVSVFFSLPLVKLTHYTVGLSRRLPLPGRAAEQGRSSPDTLRRDASSVFSSKCCVRSPSPAGTGLMRRRGSSRGSGREKRHRRRRRVSQERSPLARRARKRIGVGGVQSTHGCGTQRSDSASTSRIRYRFGRTLLWAWWISAISTLRPSCGRIDPKQRWPKHFRP